MYEVCHDCAVRILKLSSLPFDHAYEDQLTQEIQALADDYIRFMKRLLERENT